MISNKVKKISVLRLFVLYFILTIRSISLAFLLAFFIFDTFKRNFYEKTFIFPTYILVFLRAKL